jgi:hypothetical protein
MPLNLSRPRASGNDTRTRRVPGTGKPKRLTTKGIAVVRAELPQEDLWPGPASAPGHLWERRPGAIAAASPRPGEDRREGAPPTGDR